MKYLVTMSETYTYEQEVEAKDEKELEQIIHDWDPIIDDPDYVADNRESISFAMSYSYKY